MKSRRKLNGGIAFLFDLDGTLIDSVYQHVLAWQVALREAGIDLSIWRIHRRMGMSGGLFMHALVRETGRPITPQVAAQLVRSHKQAYLRQAGQVRPLPGARELLAALTQAKVPWAIATSGRLETAQSALDTLGVGKGATLITRDQVPRAKPDPDLFLAAAAPWVSACSPEATARTNWNEPAPTVSTKTPPICCATWTKWECGRRIEAWRNKSLIELTSIRYEPTKPTRD